MSNARYVGRVGALAMALGVGNVRRAATRVAVSIGAAALVMATAAPPASAASSDPPPPPDRTALVLGGTTIPTPNPYYIKVIENQYVAPTHEGEVIEYLPVTTPQELWPITGVFRILLIGLSIVEPQHAPPEFVAASLPEGYSLLKLSGLIDRTADQSLADGADDLEAAIAKQGGPLVIFGYSQGAGVANVVKKRLAEQYEGTDAPDIDFVLVGDPNLPNGGLAARFPDLYIPILNFTLNGAASTDTPFDTVEIARQYDGFSDFPLYPLNLVADLNAVAGIVFVHTTMFDVSVPAENPTESPAYVGHYGDTDYYFFESENLPLFEPLRIAGVPEPVIDVFEPVVREVVELGYDRDIKPWEPTPARVFPTDLDPVEVTTNLVDAVGEGVDNAVELAEERPELPKPKLRDQVDSTVKIATSFVGNGRNVVRGGDLQSVHTSVRDTVKHTSDSARTAVNTITDTVRSVLKGGSAGSGGSAGE